MNVFGQILLFLTAISYIILFAQAEQDRNQQKLETLPRGRAKILHELDIFHSTLKNMISNIKSNFFNKYKAILS